MLHCGSLTLIEILRYLRALRDVSFVWEVYDSLLNTALYEREEPLCFHDLVGGVRKAANCDAPILR